MARGTQHTDQTRAQVTAALLAGQGVREVSRALNVSVATVSRFKKELATPRAASSAKTAKAAPKRAPRAILEPENDEFAPDDSATFGDDVEAGLRGDDDDPDYGNESYVCPVERPAMERLGTQKKDAVSLDQLIFELLAENLATLRAQAIIARDPRWIKRYGPESLAILHGVMADKAIRILECAEAARPVEDVPSG